MLYLVFIGKICNYSLYIETLISIFQDYVGERKLFVWRPKNSFKLGVTTKEEIYSYFGLTATQDTSRNYFDMKRETFLIPCRENTRLRFCLILWYGLSHLSKVFLYFLVLLPEKNNKCHLKLFYKIYYRNSSYLFLIFYKKYFFKHLNTPII